MNYKYAHDITSEARPNIGVRVPAKTKQELCLEAKEVGIPLGEHVECLLLNRHNDSEELTKVKSLLSAERRKSEALERNQVPPGVKIELNQEKGGIFTQREMNKIMRHLNSDRFLKLFATLRGKTDVITFTGGEEIRFDYNCHADLLAIMIYTFDINNRTILD